MAESQRRLSRYDVYNHLPALRIFTDTDLTTETRRQNDLLFDSLLAKGLIKGYKLDAKRRYSADLLQAAKQAWYKDGCLLVQRNKNHPKYSLVCLQVVDAWVAAGLLKEYRSLPGSPKMSRVVPTEMVKERTEEDPWAYDPSQPTVYVIVRKRKTHEEIKADPNNPDFRDTQEKLALINEVNSKYRIRYDKWCPWEEDFIGKRRLRPIHYAVYTENFKQQGRLYTGRYGHQKLRKLERRTLTFNDAPACEIDYAGMHPRLLYHLAGIDFKDDPYALWGSSTTRSQRVLVKLLINALINAESPAAAVSACNLAMSTSAKDGQRKQGKTLEKARRVYDAWKTTGLRFADLVPLVKKHHKPIAKYFGKDMGIKLMRIDSKIALAVMTHFAQRGTPVLGCHDSFLVPEGEKLELMRVMLTCYREQCGFLPLVTESSRVVLP